MPDFHIEKYTSPKKQQWDDFVKNAKNGSFLFQRDFMEYHKDRFEDYSLMIYIEAKLIAVFPANRKGNVIYSHQGLTYGGLVLPPKIKFDKICQTFRKLLQFLTVENFTELYLKPIPKIYLSYPSDELDYLLFLLKGKLVKRELSTAIYNPYKIKIQSNRLEGLKKARKNILQIKKESSFEMFWQEILIPNLKQQYDAEPVHSVEEITKLAKRFPDNIHQYNVYKEDEIVGGTTVFETKTTVHTQYISADQNRQQYGTLDFLFHYLIEEEFADKSYFDFGTSNLNRGKNLNRGLLYWKECFGARGISYDTYEINPQNYSLLDEVFV